MPRPYVFHLIHSTDVTKSQDSILERMSVDEYQAALGPKLRGSWNLHERFSKPGDLDFFVMLSSLIGVFGFASQSNYSAGSAFQDALAQHRAGLGLPGVSIDLGIVKSVGYLAEGDAEKTVETLQQHGFMSLGEGDVLAAVGSAVTTPFAGQLTLGINTGPIPRGGEATSHDRRFSGLEYRERDVTTTHAPKSGAGDLAASIEGASTLEEAVAAIEVAIGKKLADIFMIGEDEVMPSKSLAEYGVDSLVAVELRNMFALKAGAELSIFDILQSPSVSALAQTVGVKSTLRRDD